MTVENRLLDKADWYFENALTNYLQLFITKRRVNSKDYREIYRWAVNHIDFSLLGSSSMMPKK